MGDSTKHGGWSGTAAVAAFLLGCNTAAPGAAPLQQAALDGLRARGLSGTASDDQGRLWAVAETRNELYRFEGGAWPTHATRVALDGVPAERELESSAWLGSNLIALGTETERPRAEDLVLLARIDEDGARVVGDWVLDWHALFGIRAPKNQGIEGLCSTSSVVVAAGEAVVESEGRRLAPLAAATYDGATRGAWRGSLLQLTTATGKISGLDCESAPDGRLVVYAIERHYGVARLLTFELDPKDGPRVVQPEVRFDLGAGLQHIPNMEAVSVVGGRLIILTDHDEDAEDGETETFFANLNEG